MLKKQKSEEINIFDASQQGDFESVQKYVNFGGDINVRDGLGWSPLHLACMSGNGSLVKYLVEETKADEDAEDNNGGLLPYDRAFMNGKLEVMRFFMQKNVCGVGSLEKINKFIFTRKFAEKGSVHVPDFSLENVSFLRVSDFLSAKSIPSYATCKEQGWHQTGNSVCDESSQILYICHKWETIESPDPKGVHFKVISEFLEKAEAAFDYIWVDYSCVCTDRSSELFIKQWKSIPIVLGLSTHMLVVPTIFHVTDEQGEKGPRRPPPPKSEGKEDEEKDKEPEGTPTTNLNGLLKRGWVAAEVLMAVLGGATISVYYHHGDQVHCFVEMDDNKVDDPVLGSGEWFEAATLKALAKVQDSEELLDKLYDHWYGMDNPLKPMEKTVWLFAHLMKKNLSVLQVSLQTYHHFLPDKFCGLDAKVKAGLSELLKQEPYELPIERFEFDLLRRNMILPKGPYADTKRPPIEKLYPPLEKADASAPKSDAPPTISQQVQPTQQPKAGAGKDMQPKGSAGQKQRGKRARDKDTSSAERAHQAIKKIVQQLWKHKVKNWGNGKNSPFATVITRENCAKLGVPNYFDFVQEPMNLTWIKDKSDKKKYSSILDFIEDCNLMLNNALKFNREGEDIHTEARFLKGKFEKWIESDQIGSLVQEAKKIKT